ncbi:putative disease resistance protein RGA3 [Malania oleifera]|uniref:putative disease resistance protein RGA3 n=1 Tax=Malania oleifera TaxID=397392 RepID=UPI0025AE9AAB|nr:putative disease resistance protein RGA3 [Malania oleifera]
MAEAILFGLAETLLEKLGSRAFQEIGLAWAVKDEVQKLNHIISILKNVLLDAEEQSSHNCKITTWLQELQDVIYDAEDLLDDVSTTALQQKVITQKKLARKVRLFFSSYNPIVFGLKMGHRIKAIRERLDEHAKLKNDFNLTDQPTESRLLKYREKEQTHSFFPQEKVIGREDDKNKIVDRLLDSNPVAVGDNFLVIPIVGIGGLGKTTLAQYVYNDEKIGKHFKLKMWVCVSNDFNMKRIVENILESATKKKIEGGLKIDILQDRLRKEIGGKKYLLVLDDVWSEDHTLWDKLKDLLNVCASGSKIIVTTRSHRVAEITSPVEPYVLKGLDEQRSWDLFKKMAFKPGEEPQNQVEIGKEIVRKCSGVPLAIQTLGSLLCSQDTKYWLSIKNKEFSNMDQEENDIIPVLRLSYDDLPSYLKHCFAYCSVYPKDSEIKKRTLIQLWMANGFLHSQDGKQCAEEIGDQYFTELLRRSFFQDVQRNKRDDDIESYKMHDLMHGVAELVAGEGICRGSSEAANITEKTRHLSFPYESKGYLTEIPSTLFNAGTCLRTLLLPSSIKVNETCLRKIISRFRCLRVLDLHMRGIEMLPGSIGKLKQLRYLDLSSNSSMKRLPESITCLVNLQTLKLSGCEELEELPRDIENLVNLVHLDLDRCVSLRRMPRGVGQLSYLRTLSRFVVGKNATTSGGLSELKGLNNLEGKLKIVIRRRIKSAEASEANLKEKQHLRDLELEWRQESNEDGEEDDYESVLEGLQSPPKLRELVIRGYGGRRWPSWMINMQSFTKLEELHLWGCPQLESLPDGMRCLTSLRELHLQECPQLESLPDGMRCLTSLQELWIVLCPRLLSLGDEERFRGLASLKTLSIKGCDGLKALPVRGIQHLISLKELHISTCIEMELLDDDDDDDDDYDDGKQWENLNKSLREVRIKGIPKMVRLPRWLQHCTSLQALRIKECRGLGNLPEWMGNLTSLQELRLWGCPQLESLPDGMRCLTSLQQLRIYQCPLLEKRCEKETGEDWRKIAHIPSIRTW